MSDAEKRLRAVLAKRCEQGAPTTGTFQHEALDALLAEHRAALSRARTDALEEAEGIAEACRKERETLRRGLEASEGQHAGHRLTWLSCKESEAERIRDAIINSKREPAPATIPVERAREVLSRRLEHFSGPPETERTGTACGVVRLLAQDLGVDLDAKGEAVACIQCRQPVEAEDVTIFPDVDTCRRCHNKATPGDEP